MTEARSKPKKLCYVCIEVGGWVELILQANRRVPKNRAERLELALQIAFLLVS